MRRMAFGVAAFSAAALLGCDSGPRRMPRLHQYTMSYDFTIEPDQAPPHARDDIHYKVTILDRKTRAPIENGIGQLFAGKPIDEQAPTGPQSKTWDGLAYGPEVGVYHAKLNFVVPGLWAMAVRFQRDSLHPLERTDWYQDVMNERPSNIP